FLKQDQHGPLEDHQKRKFLLGLFPADYPTPRPQSLSQDLLTTLLLCYSESSLPPYTKKILVSFVRYFTASVVKSCCCARCSCGQCRGSAHRRGRGGGLPRASDGRSASVCGLA